MSRIAIIDFGAGNLYSVEKAVRHVAPAEAEIFLCREAEELENATHIILPGVGAFADCMQGLAAIPGMIEALNQQVMQHKKPFFGICVGMQMLFEQSEEHGVTEGLGWLRGKVVALGRGSGSRVQGAGFSEDDDEEKEARSADRAEPSASEASRNWSDSSRDRAQLNIPHMGWNELQLTQPQHPYFSGIQDSDHAYFVHSYHCLPEEVSIIAAQVEYGQRVVAAIAQDNLFATQFHPEKSQKTGLRILQNFLQLPHAD